MRVLIINSVYGYGSTGRIVSDLANSYRECGDIVKIAYGRVIEKMEEDIDAVRIGSGISIKCNVIKARLFDNDGFAAYEETKKFLEWADAYNPDLVWLHNLHGYYINIELLFNWIKKRNSMKVRWTLHDCWAFTGHCSCFTFNKCEKWRSHCEKCPQKKEYPKSILRDNSKTNYDKKRSLFTGINDMTIITPSQWLANLVEESFLKEYDVEVVNNTIDEDIFKPRKSDFRSKNGLNGKKIILGVSAQWQPSKGYGDFLKMKEIMPDEYVIVLVGVTKKQLKRLPKGIIGVIRTNSREELAELYSMADVFFNPTYEDNYPTVNLEAKACGTMVVTYNTGGSPESVEPQNVVETGDLMAAIKRIEVILAEEKDHI